MRVSFLLALSILLSPIVLAADEQPTTSTSATTPQTYFYKLDNGLRLYVRPDHRAPVTVTQIWYQVGSSYEFEGITGISHALEHLMFKGTHAYPEGEFVNIIAENGGEQNAFTSLDYTVYYEELEARRLPLAFELEADRMRNLVFNDEELIKERDIVAEERRMRTEDNPVSRMYEKFNAVAQASSPYRYPVIGWMDDIMRYSREDIQMWYDAWYVPKNAIVVVVGDVDPEIVYDLAQHYFGPLPATVETDIKIPTTKKPPQVPPLGERKIKIAIPAMLSYVYMGYNVPVVNTASESWEPYALDVLENVLSLGQSSRLDKELVRDQLLAADVGASYDPFERLDTLFLMGGVPSQGRTIDELETALLAQIERLQQQLITPAELTRVKTQVIANEIYARDSLTRQALQIGSLASVGLDPSLADDYVNNINAVTAEQVQLVAQRYLTSDRLTVGILEPQQFAHAPAAPVIESSVQTKSETPETAVAKTTPQPTNLEEATP